jgi:hypothetical protein
VAPRRSGSSACQSARGAVAGIVPRGSDPAPGRVARNYAEVLADPQIDAVVLEAIEGAAATGQPVKIG